MKKAVMKGKNVEEATNAALAVLGERRERATIKVLNEGRPAMLGVIGGEDAEVEVSIKEPIEAEAREVTQSILDRMGFVAMVDKAEPEEGGVQISIKGDDMGRIIGKEGAMLKSLETVIGAILWKQTGERVRVGVDAGGYKEKREQALHRLAEDVVREVVETGKEKEMPRLSAADRRLIHMHLKDNARVETVSYGEGADRRLIIKPRP
jgi:spoIIIJ-associated protein